LERLHLGSNKIEYLPPELFTALTKLKELFVYKNKISAIPSEIGNLQGILIAFFEIYCTYFFLCLAIQKLSFSNNNIRVLPDEIGACTTLEELYLSNNAKFNYFPSSAGHLRFVFQISFIFLVVIQFSGD
jgi:Leucine-rich repeat (LRR) protein